MVDDDFMMFFLGIPLMITRPGDSTCYFNPDPGDCLGVQVAPARAKSKSGVAQNMVPKIGVCEIWLEYGCNMVEIW